ncbi:MAG: formylmethanofuran dehydrogenase [Methanobacteriaceae archaeon]|jgi:formylmethanofuran dehydrogenase subunit E|nr:MAG: formylmethanofuran dehydrogenase [Methanobacterium sp. BRmetb2]MCC7557668.1 formylmethanofuran dehydrogenase [Methanobacteriaceae archaeon]
MDEITDKINNPQMIEQIDKVVPFHGHLSTGAFIGIQMLNLAFKLLDVKENERVYVTCETLNCLPDPFQIICGCTVGNKRLKVHDYEKMAITMNKMAKIGESYVKGVRIFLDPSKTVEYPLLHSWYMNKKKISHEDAISDLIEARDSVYSWEYVQVKVPKKEKKNIVICEICNESFISKDGGNICLGCLNSKNQSK